MQLSFIRNLSRRSLLSILSVIVLLAGVGVTVIVLQQRQEQRSRAAGNPPPTFKVKAHVVSVNGAAPAANYTFWMAKFYDTSGSVDSTLSTKYSVTGGAYTDWMTVGPDEVARGSTAWPNTQNQLTYPAQLVTNLVIKGAVDTTVVEGSIYVEETGETTNFTAEMMGEKLGIFSYRKADNTAAAGTTAQFNKRYWDIINSQGGDAGSRPKNFVIWGRFFNWDNDRIAWREGFQNMAKLGLTTMMGKESNEQPAPSSNLRKLMEEAGFNKTSFQVYNPPGYAFDFQDPLPGDSGEPPTPQGLTDWANRFSNGFTAAGFTKEQVAHIGMSDEPAWVYPQMLNMVASKPAAQTEFNDYLKSQGLTPGELGKSEWSQVLPTGRSNQEGSLQARKLYYWSMRFFAWASSTHFANAAKALEKAFYPKVPIATNENNYVGRLFSPNSGGSNNPDPNHPDSAVGAHDWQEFGRLGGGTTLFAEDWFPDSYAYQWSDLAARMRSAATPLGNTFGGYVVLRATGTTPDGALKKAMALVGQGGKDLSFYHFGPDHQGVSDSSSEILIKNPSVIKNIIATSKLIGKTEDLLWPGKPSANPVGILAPRSAEIWDKNDPASPIFDNTNGNLNGRSVDYMLEAHDIYLALQHSNIPVDWVDEDTLTPANLANFKVLYVTEPNIPKVGQDAIAAWVQAGGTLITVPGAGTKDQYNDSLMTVSTIGGVEESPYSRKPILAPLDLASIGNVTDTQTGTKDSAYVVKHSFITIKGSVEASFDDGLPALLNTPVGSGRVYHFGFFPGVSYFRSRGGDGLESSPLPTFTAATLRTLIKRPIETAGVKPPVEVNKTMVETPVLTSAGGSAITLLNWNNSSISTLSMKYRAPFGVSRVNSAKHGDLTFANTADGITFTLPDLDAVDVVRVYSGGPITNPTPTTPSPVTPTPIIAQPTPTPTAQTPSPTTSTTNQAPLITNAAISPQPISTNGTNQYTVTLTGSDGNGGSDITAEYAIINYLGPNAGSLRGYFGWSNTSTFPHWNSIKTASAITCSGGGQAAINGEFGAEYLKLISCTALPVSGSTRSVSLVVAFEPIFTTPVSSNTLSGYVQDQGGLTDGSVFKSFDTFNLAASSPTTAPSPTLPPTTTAINLNLLLHGIGKAGDSASPGSGGNTSPQRVQRNVKIEVFNSQNQLALTKDGIVSFDPSTGSFRGNVDLGTTVASGVYTIKVKSDQYLKKLVPGIQNLTTNTINVLPQTTLTTGDMNADNRIDILDYNIIIDCYADLTPAKNCSDNAKKLSADITDDGAVNQFDYNLFLRELTNIMGE